MNILKEYQPLFFDDFFICDLWGGRAGARSHHLTANSLYNLLYEKDFRAFFLRETHSSIFGSMWQDFIDRVEEYQELHDLDLSYIEISRNQQGENYAKNTITGGSIRTKGFKAGSGSQTANLKSLAGATHLYIEETEEVGYLEFKKVRQSLRKKGVKIKVVRAFNPPPQEHWIWKDYDFIPLSEQDLINEIHKLTNEPIEKIEQVVYNNRFQQHTALDGIYMDAKPKNKDLIHVRANYNINRKNLNEVAIRNYVKDLYDDFHLFCTSILGFITSGSDRNVYQGWIKRTPTDWFEQEGDLLYYLDFGDTVPNAMGCIKFNENERHILPLFSIPNREQDIIESLELANISKSVVIVADSAQPKEIRRIKEAGYTIRAVSKSHDANVSAIQQLRRCQVYVYGDEVWNEYVGYRYAENKTGEILKDQVPAKGNDHHMDGIKYAEIGKKYVSSNFKIEHKPI